MELMLNDAQVAFIQAVAEAGIVSVDRLNDWLENTTEVPQDVGEAICQAGLVNEFELTQKLGHFLSISMASDIELEMYAQPHPMIPRDLCVELLFVPLSEGTESPFPIAVTNPLDEEGFVFLKEQLGVEELKIQMAMPSNIRAEIDACYGTAEEWAAYLKEQGIELEQTYLEKDEVLHDEDLEPISTISNNDHEVTPERLPHAQVFPDWSSHDPTAEEEYAALTKLVDI